MVPPAKRMPSVATGTHGTITQNSNLRAPVVFCSLCMNLGWGKQTLLWFTVVYNAKHTENWTLGVANHTEMQNQRNEGFEGSQKVIQSDLCYKAGSACLKPFLTDICLTCSGCGVAKKKTFDTGDSSA